MNPFILLQAVTPATSVALTTTAQTVQSESYLSLVMKGGWVLLPIFILSILAIYIIIYKCIVLSKLGKKDSRWLSRVLEFIYEGKIDKSLKFCAEVPYSSAKIIASGLKDADKDIQEIEIEMETEARQQVSRLESMLNYLGIIASIAPMLGFLGTIFGVIRIFYDIAKTNDLSIDTISTGLYQKMICSGAGLLVGIIAYCGYYLLSGRVDRLVVLLDKQSNEALRALRSFKKSKSE